VQDKKYKAFISYSHQDETFAKWLHKKLESYKIPKELYEENLDLPKKLFPIFRDRKELSTSSDLGTEILKALHHSKYLIIICSIHSAKSQWVNQEIIDFKAKHGEKKVHAIIIDGEPHAKDSDKFDDDLECFPEALKYKVIDGELSNEPTEPIAGDFRKGKDGKEHGKLKLISGLLGVGFDELNQREEKRKRRNRLIWSIISISLIVIMAGLTIFSFKQMKIAELNQLKAEEQLIIATNKTQSLSILTTKTIQALANSDESTLEKYLKNILDSNEKTIFIEMTKPLILEADFITNEEKKYWMNILDGIDEKSLSKLVKVLMVTKIKLKKVNGKVKNVILKLVEKDDKLCFKQKNLEKCMESAYLRMGFSHHFDKNQSIEKYFKFYRGITKEFSPSYYNTYSKFLQQKGKEIEAITYVEKSIFMDLSNLDINKSTIMGKVERLFTLQYKINSTRIIEELYPKYKQLLELTKHQRLSVYLNVLYYTALSYADLKQYDKSIKFLQQLIHFYYSNDKKDDVRVSWIANKYLYLAWYQLITKNYKEAIISSQKGIKLDVTKVLILETNLAHAYLLSGDFKKAKIIYLKNIGKKFEDKSLWEDAIIKDFKALKKEGIYNKDFEKIAKLFREKSLKKNFIFIKIKNFVLKVINFLHTKIYKKDVLLKRLYI